jgi:hypothetical protein
MKIFSVEFYNVGSGFKKDEDWKRYRSAYVVAKDIDSAQSVATKNQENNEIVIGIRENVDQVLYME